MRRESKKVHELGMCASIVEAVEARAGERRVAEIRVRIGTLHRVSPEAFQQSFEIAASGTVAQGARAEMVILPVVSHCLSCGADTTGAEETSFCAVCGGDEIVTRGGDELVLESLTYAE